MSGRYAYSFDEEGWQSYHDEHEQSLGNAAVDVAMGSADAGEEDVIMEDPEAGVAAAVVEQVGAGAATDLNEVADLHSQGVHDTRLYNLMCIISDKQDLSFVEKVALPKEEIFSLCNKLVRNSARVAGHDRQDLIDFESLNSSALRTVGFYGHKDVIVEIFSRVGIVDRDTIRRMRDGTLQPGLHAAVHEHTLYLLYWHQGENLSNATRKDISCTFIRYLVELCDIVHICLNSAGLADMLPASGRNFPQKQRMQRLKISVVKASENDLKIRAGFQADLPKMPRVVTSPCTTTACEEPEQSSSQFASYRLTEGFHHAAVLVATERPPISRPHQYRETFKVQEFPGIVKQWEAENNLDLRSLEHKEFLLFLECSESEAFREYGILMENLAKRQTDQRNKLYDLDTLVAEQEERALEIARRGVSAFLTQYYPWEEGLLSDRITGFSEDRQASRPSADSASSITSVGPDSGLIGADFNSGLWQHVGNASNCELGTDTKTGEAFGSQLELEMCGLWIKGFRATSSESQLLFLGSEISFMTSPTEAKTFPTIKSLTKKERFIISESKHSGVGPLGPVWYGQEYCLQVSGNNEHTKELTIRFSTMKGQCEAGPVLICQPIFITLQQKHSYGGKPLRVKVEHGIKVHKVPESDPMKSWIASFADLLILDSLKKRASLVGFAIETCIRPILASHNSQIHDHLQSLIQAMMSGSFDEFSSSAHLSSNVVNCLQSEWARIQSQGLPADVEEMPPDREVIIACCDIYKKVRDAFHAKVAMLVKNNIVPHLRTKVRNDLDQEIKELEEHAKDEERSYIMNLQQNFSQKRSELPTLSITGCSPKDRTTVGKITNWFRGLPNDSSIVINFTKEELQELGAFHVCKCLDIVVVMEKENVTWNMIELAPMKKDLDAVNLKQDHLLNPKFSSPHKLIDIDSHKTRLSKVVYLRSGQILVFIQQFVGEPLHDIYLSSKHGNYLSNTNPIRTFKKAIDILAFEEVSKFLAVYAQPTASINIFRFDDTFYHLDFIGIQVSLNDYVGSSNLIWMEFVPGKGELVLVNDAQCMQVLELTQPAMFRPGKIQLPAPFCKACISADGACFITFSKIKANVNKTDKETEDKDASKSPSLAQDYTDVEVRNSQNCAEACVLVLDIYRLDTMSHLKTMELDDIIVSDIKSLEAKMVWFGPQMHLLIHDSRRPELICSKLLEITSVSEVCQLAKVQNNVNGDQGGRSSPVQKDASSCPELDYMYHIFDKYSTSPPLAETHGKNVEHCLKLVLRDSMGLHDPTVKLGERCIHYMKHGIEKLQKEKGKDFSLLEISFVAQSFDAYVTDLDKTHGLHMAKASTSCSNTPMGLWMQRLVCLVPIQIARAENNSLKPLVDGLQILPHLNYADALSLAELIRFGFYESVLESWVGDIKVISSMGKQSSGKSYLLNHLSGSLLDVAGGRCTDGVWMTICPTSSCLYVLLDFEGLGSFERSEQEDMLLSLLNAAMSNITIFNKKDFHLDKETEAVFERFQNGVSLVKQDDKLFKGLFYMAIKDVDGADVEDLENEFYEKIAKICNKTQHNFLTKMYGGNVAIASMPPFHRSEFQESINQIAETVQGLHSHNQNGRSFNRDLKLVIAQISAKDWSPIDSKRVAFKITLLRKHLISVISSGCLADVAVAENHLINFDTKEPIPEFAPLHVDGEVFELVDTNAQMAPHKNQVIGSILDPLRKSFELVVARKGSDDERWHAAFQNFLIALATRRKRRTLEWLSANTADFQQDGDVQKLRLEALTMLADLQQQLSLCGSKCERCFLRCILERSHPKDHSCKGDHRCMQMCTYCSDDNVDASASVILKTQVNGCSDLAGHEGPHDCKQKAHTCGMDCSYAGKTSNCNKNCSLKARHEGEHKCNSRQHMCVEKCSLPACRNPCVTPIELGDHEQHACHEKMCPAKCTMPGCNRNCASANHFHDLEPRNHFLNHHFCENEHQCTEQCETPGLCEVRTEVVKKTCTYQGKRSTFEYEHVSEQNGNRKDCCIAIPPFKEHHDGPHSHTMNANVVHFCDTRCQACQYFCNLPFMHAGLHNTTHGNMRSVNFVSEVEDFEILDRKYTWGESGLAEMCMMYCKAQGRGHIHLTPCQKHNNGACAGQIMEGARHETRKYGPDFDTPKDEFTHAAFWKHIRFKDPCSEEDQKQFALCNHQCPSSDHVSSAVGSSSASAAQQQISFCPEILWHAPIPKTKAQVSGTGYVTDDGHYFSCDHSKNMMNHVIFVIDRSYSMEEADCKPILVKFSQRHANRLGSVYDAIVQFIRTRLAAGLKDSMSVVLFDETATTAFECQDMAENLTDQLLQYHPRGGTTYSCGIAEAEALLSRASKIQAIQRKSPTVIFLSDGGNNGGSDPVQLVKGMKQVEPKLVFHTIKFGSDPYNQILMDMASAGGGTFQVSLDEVQLSKNFEGLARSLRPKVAALM